MVTGPKVGHREAEVSIGGQVFKSLAEKRRGRRIIRKLRKMCVLRVQVERGRDWKYQK